MDNTEYLAGIESELHNLNLNLLELIKVLKERNNTPEPVTDEITYDSAIQMHEQILTDSAKNVARTPEQTESEYLRKQANFDQALKHLGVL